MLMLVHVPLPRLFLRMNHELTARLGVSRPGVEEDRELLESVARTSLRTKLREEIADNVSDSGIGGYDKIWCIWRTFLFEGSSSFLSSITNL